MIHFGTFWLVLASSKRPKMSKVTKKCIKGNWYFQINDSRQRSCHFFNCITSLTHISTFWLFLATFRGLIRLQWVLSHSVSRTKNSCFVAPLGGRPMFLGHYSRWLSWILWLFHNILQLLLKILRYIAFLPTLVITKGSIFWNVCTFWTPLLGKIHIDEPKKAVKMYI